MSKETFKGFVRSHPELISRVSSGQMTWQRFYEMYDLYGENNEVWKDYLEPVTTTGSTVKKSGKDASLQELIQMVKNVDLETVRKGVNGLQKAIGIIQDLGIGSSSKEAPKPAYEPRPMYKYFED